MAWCYVVCHFFNCRARNDLKCSFKEDVQNEVCASLDRAATVVPGLCRILLDKSMQTNTTIAHTYQHVHMTTWSGLYHTVYLLYM